MKNADRGAPLGINLIGGLLVLMLGSYVYYLTKLSGDPLPSLGQRARRAAVGQ